MVIFNCSDKSSETVLTQCGAILQLRNDPNSNLYPAIYFPKGLTKELFKQEIENNLIKLEQFGSTR